MISLMQVFTGKFHRFAGGGFLSASIILSFLLFSFVNAQDDDEFMTVDPSDETAVSGDEAPPPSDETAVSSDEAPPPSDETSFSDDGTSGAGDETSSTNYAAAESSVQPSTDLNNPVIDTPTGANYTNYAQKGSYENEFWWGEVPQWHYYDMFGNKIIDGFYLYGLSKNGNDVGTGQSNLALHPFLRMWCGGLVQVADLEENGGIMAMIGDRVRSEFTPFTFRQTLFTGSRFDMYYRKMLSMTFLSNRISNTGTYGMVVNQSTAMPNADWLTGLHARAKFGEEATLGGTYVNLHHEDSKSSENPFSGVDSDTLTKGTYNGLSLHGLDLKLDFGIFKANGEYVRSQEFYDGKFKPKAGVVATLNSYWDVLEILRLGGEFYSIGSRFQTTFSCPAHPYGDGDGPFAEQIRVGKYQYTLIDDNDDKDEFPENGRSKYQFFTQKISQGDPDGTIPLQYDKDKNGQWDYDEAFLNYDADPLEAQILFDRNNNGTPDEIEDDAYPDYPYVPSYYLPGERYYRYDDIDTVWKNKYADGQTVHKGLAGYHLYTRFSILPNLELTVGGIFDRSQEKTFQATYENGVKTGEIYDLEKASNIYFLAHYKGTVGRDVHVSLDNFFRKVQDNIPNHTLGFKIDPGTEEVSYYPIIDELDFRDMFSNATRAEFTLFKNRGFNYTGVVKFEFQKHTPHLEFNYSDITISYLTLVNKCHYTILLPFFKDMFLIPKYKNIWESCNYSPRPDSADPTFNPSVDYRFRRNVMINSAHLVLDWKLTEKTGIITGWELKQFNDFIDGKENYFQPCFRTQLSLKDRYAGMLVVLTTGFSWYKYIYGDSGEHNPLNNPQRAVKNIAAHEIFIKIHSGF